MADKTVYEEIVILFNPQTPLQADASGNGHFDIAFAFPGTYRTKAQLFLQLPEGVAVDPQHPPKLSQKDSARLQPLKAFSGHPANNPQLYMPRWLTNGQSDPVLLASGSLSNDDNNDFKVAVTVWVNVATVAANAKIKAWVLDEQNTSVDLKTKHKELLVAHPAPSSEPAIHSVVHLTPGHENANVWWVKDTDGATLTVEATQALSGDVYLLWQKFGDSKWHAISERGKIDEHTPQQVAFKLQGDTTLNNLIAGSNGVHLKIGLKANSDATPGPKTTIDLNIQKENTNWRLGTASASFTAQGKLTVKVQGATPATSSGIKSSEYSIDGGGTWSAFKENQELDAHQDFRQGIEVRATSYLEQVSAVVEATIDATGIYNVVWPNYENATVGTTLPFNVTVTAKNNLLLPIENATVTLPVGMKSGGQSTFIVPPSELKKASFSHTETVTVAGPAGTVINNATLGLKSSHFKTPVVISDNGDKGKYVSAVPSDALNVRVVDAHPVTNSTRPFVDVKLAPAPHGKTVHIQYQEKNGAWKDIPPGDVHANNDGKFRVSLPNELIKSGHISGLKLRAKTGTVSQKDADFHPSAAIDIAIKDDKPTIKSVVIVRGMQGHLVARVTVHSDANNPVVNAHIHKEGDPAASRPENWEAHTPSPSGGDQTIDIPITGKDLRHIKVEVVNKAGVLSEATAARLEQYNAFFDVQFQLDGNVMASNTASNVKAGDHNLEVIVTPKFHLSSYHLDGFLGTKGQLDAKLHKKGAPVVTGGAELDQRALGEWDGHHRPHLLAAKKPSSVAGEPQSYKLTFHLIFPSGEGAHHFEVRLSDGAPAGHTDPSHTNEGIYTATFNMAH